MALLPLNPVLVTHSGRFHCDEVFAYAILRLALGLSEPGRDHRLIRTRDPVVIQSADVAWDVGTVFDPAAGRFDHHQRGAPLRPDGTPYSAAGLIWQVYGEPAVAALLAASAVSRARPTVFAPAITAELDESVLRRIDELDNGVSSQGPVLDDLLGLGRLIADFNPVWDSAEAASPHSGDAAFLEAAAMAEGVLCRRVEAVRARLQADAMVLAAHAAGADPRILVLDRGMPWKVAAFSHDLPVIFTVSPAANGNWMVDAMPPDPGSFGQRLPLPESWAGLEGQELAAASGVADAVFVHVRRFVGAARSRAGAIAMAELALKPPVA
jgi:uncharacterized UPF0160 family protein